MRCLLITLMIVLLPMRGWAGNAMAVDMAAQQMLMAHISVASTAAMTAGSVMPADCPMHLQAVDDKSGQAGTTAVHCHSCDTCQLCLALGSWTHTAWFADTMRRPASPLLADHDFRSAETTASFKPPIFRS